MMVTIKAERFIKASQVNHTAPDAPAKVAKALFRTEFTNGTQTWVAWTVWSSVGVYVAKPMREQFETRKAALVYLAQDMVQTPAWARTPGAFDAPLRTA